jgi:opacity protein-like surface antigen
MKNFLTLMVILLLNTFTSFSQDKGYIALSLGPSFPLGEFASKDMDNESAGFAKPGAIFDLSFGYKLGKNVGVTALLRGQSNKLDGNAISNEMSKQLPDDVSEQTKVGSWAIGAFLAGVYSSIPVAKQVTFETRLMMGVLSVKAPEILIDLTGPGGTAWVKQKSASTTAFAYLAGIGIKYDAGKRVAVLANIDYLGAKPQFDNVEITTNLLDLQNETNDYTQDFGSINVSFGIGYRF